MLSILTIDRCSISNRYSNELDAHNYRVARTGTFDVPVLVCGRVSPTPPPCVGVRRGDQMPQRAAGVSVTSGM